LGLDESVRVSPSSCAVQIDFCALAGLGARDFESEGGAAFAPSERANKSNRPISPRSPWQNPYIERLIGTLWRDCLDHVLILGEWHLRRVLTLYSLYYNETRTHLGLSKDAPRRRAVQLSGAIVTAQVLSGLHHRYMRI
jgi:hypothetical protein